jgi:molybdate/tungstate transport system substrate-binding protein
MSIAGRNGISTGGTRLPARAGAAALAGALVLALAACGSSSGGTSSGSSPSAAAKGHGPVDVLYAGSLVNVMEKGVGPGFNSTTGYTFQGFSAGAKALANQIKGQVRPGDVFLSAAPKVNSTLEGSKNGNWVSWYVTFAKSPLVIGYNPNSKFAAALKTKPWYQVLSEPGIKIGRTDPATDPKGMLTVQALQQAAQVYHQPNLASAVQKNSTVFPEETMVGRLQSGQLDAGFFYTSEAVPVHIPTVTLGAVHLGATYTATVLNKAPHAAGGSAFVQYLLGPKGKSTLTADGLTLTPPTVSGDASAVPSSVKPLVSGPASPGS